MNILNAITSVFGKAAPFIINQAKSNDTLINLLNNWQIDLTKHPDNKFEIIYASALFVYFNQQQPPDFLDSKEEAILEILRHPEIKIAFDEAYYQDNYDIVVNKITQLSDWQDQDWNKLGESISKFNINISQVIAEFQAIFIQMVKLSQTTTDRLIHRDIERILQNQSKLQEMVSELQPPSKPQNVNPDSFSYPAEFAALIEEKTKLFCGRKFVFDAFNQFVINHKKGYFTVVADPGMGKSAIAAKYVSENKPICYFNSFNEGRTSPEQFLISVCQQLSSRYDLPNPDNNLQRLLQQVSEKLPDGERLVIVVDALDEVEQKSGGNILYLPTTLPDKVYFLLTRRPYIDDQKRLLVQTPVKEIDLTSDEYVKLSEADIKNYIQVCLTNDAYDYKDGLNQWIQERQENITHADFIAKVAEKSENNFMYLYFVLPDIAQGQYDDLNLQALPDGLQDYYATHWERMGMTTKEKEQKARILYVLLEAGKPISCAAIASITQQDEHDVWEVIEEWTQFLRRQQIKQETCYSMYHKSFSDFLRDKPTLKKNRLQLKDIQLLISQYNDSLWAELETAEDEGDNE